MAFIRPFGLNDKAMVMYICRATLPPTLASSEAAYRIAPYLWTLQYTHLFPSNCFILDDGSGRAVGYVIGCPDVFALAREYPCYVAEVLGSEQGRNDVPVPPQLHALQPWLLPEGPSGRGKATRVNETCLSQTAYNVRWLLLEGVQGKQELVTTYRATMHIDLLPEFQGQGWGKMLIETFAESIKAAGKHEDGRSPQALSHGKGIHIGVSSENTKVVPFYTKTGFRVYGGGEKEGNVWMVRDI